MHAYVVDFEHSLTCARLEALAPGMSTTVIVRPEDRAAAERPTASATLSADGQDLEVSVEVDGSSDKHTWSWPLLHQKLIARRRK